MRAYTASLLLGLVGCGGSSLTPPTAPAPTPLLVETLDGWSGAAVAAAVSPSAPLPGAVVTAEAAGYLPRVQAAAPRLFLWPQDEAYVRPLVYTPYSPGQLLARWARGFTVRPLAGNEADVDAVVGEAAAATGLPIASDLAGEVLVEVDPDDPAFVTNPAAVALARRDFSGSTIVGCRLVFRAFVKRAWLLHELGHCLGLGHSTLAGDVMTPGGGNDAQMADPHFSAAERVALRMMYGRRATGNAAPDREAAAGAAGQRSLSIVVVD